MEEIEKGDLIQIVKEDHQFFGAICIVSKIKKFGCQAYFLVPSDVKRMVPMFIKLENDYYEKVGRAINVVDPY